jgi:hypothetical protein
MSSLMTVHIRIVSNSRRAVHKAIEYNMGQQIVLFIVELDPLLNSVYNHMMVPRPPPVSPAQARFPPDRKETSFATYRSAALATSPIEKPKKLLDLLMTSLL